MDTRRRPGRAAGEEGLSSVVSAVLVFALLVTITLLWTMQTLPEMVADREAAHQNQVVERFTLLRGGLDALSAADDPGTVSATIPLGAAPVPVLQAAPASGGLSVPSDFSVTGAFESPVLHLVDGATSDAPTEPVDNNVLSDVTSMQGLLISFTSSGVAAASATAWVEATAYDGNDTVTFRVAHVARNAATACSDAEVHVQITTPSGTTTQPLLCGVGIALSDYTVDALASTHGFRAALRRLATPYTITLTEGGTDPPAGVFSAVWKDSEGLLQAAGPPAATTYSLAHSGARLEYAPRYNELVPQTLSWEGGAIVRSQGDGMVVHTDPSFRMAVDGTTGHLFWTLVRLDGAGSLAGRSSATTTVEHVLTSQVVLETTNATFTVDSPHAAAWRTFFEDRVTVSGATDNASVSGTDTAVLELSTDTPAVDSWRIHLRTVEANVGVS